MSHVSELFGCMVFNDRVMRERLPKDTHKALMRTITHGLALDSSVAHIVANAMKDWAIERGATHYCHWFHPLSNVTAEKHDSFIAPTEDGEVIMEFSGKELIQGESDASAFPSGGLRATFEARGYTAWDPTSYAFVKDGTLVIPTAFCSHGGEALDKKTPLLRSMEAINRQALRITKLFGHGDDTRILSTSGLEQEYFLVDESQFRKRRDLCFCGRTLFGAPPPKGQGDHYAGSIKPRVLQFMRDVDEELWKLGVSAKTRHNEAAPSQHELAPVFTTTNIATDHNLLTMSVMRDVARRHGLVCLFHEKPFDGVNGSGKHNNWSLITNTGVNLFDPGATPQTNAQFLLFLCAVLKAVDLHQDLIRLSASSAGNDCRLGGHEAPPGIISVFLGDELTTILESIENETAYVAHDTLRLEMGLDILPNFPREITDRNRTSPMAFTGNKFELRLLGASFSGSESSMVMNTIVADVLSDFANILEGDKQLLTPLLRDTIKAHKRIIFNGNNYADEWVTEAAARGLLNIQSTVDAIPYYCDPKNLALFLRQSVFRPHEVTARSEIITTNYSATVHIEALTMLDMALQEIIPSVVRYSTELAQSVQVKTQVSITAQTERELLERIDTELTGLYETTKTLEQALHEAQALSNQYHQARHYRATVLPIMVRLRAHADVLEGIIARDAWSMPTYGDLLFSV